MTGTVGTAADTSPEALLKQAVTGAKPAMKSATKAAPNPVVAAVATPTPWMRRVDPRLAGLVGAALLVGAGLGAGATRLGTTGEDRAATAMAQLQHQLGTARAETDRIATALAQLGKGLAQVQDGTEAVRGEVRTRGTAVMERVGRSEQALAAKLAALSERVEQNEKDHAARLTALTAQVEKRAAVPAPAPVAAKAVPDKAVEPTETGAITDKAHAAPKPPASDNWAVREVYDGIAVLEDRKRRLVEVGIGDMVPGVGRIETIERRGRSWAVVTRQGVITAQTW
ncbi:hypothetical protein ASF28_16815 [Methylobacterium sp. Leaf99]|uniref:hypothetical protein n=1 Tax=Methylobacterium sp. Leaf99 TaxID=1736251 RepID=UPI0006FF5388|nr:hypothetical protein [Methylobacterium sp. Leaf99]KQP06699.1 hypothetical protein ASF28_16815 [Methylobacterium sp. Leaf99]